MIYQGNKTNRPSWALTWVLVAVFSACAALLTFALRRDAAAPAGYDKLSEIRAYVDAYYVGEFTDEELNDMLATGFMYGINDKWAYYTPKDQVEAYDERVTGTYGGVGVTVDQTGVPLKILEVSEGSPADEAGIKPFDLIYKVEGELVEDIGVNATVSRVRGAMGTFVNITVLRGEEELDFTLERREIHKKYIYSEIYDGATGYIRLTDFNGNAAEAFASTLESMRASGVAGLVIDMRNNPGGQLNILLDMLDQIMPEGDAFIQRTKSGEEHRFKMDAVYWDVPVAVLVNEYSYSTAEYFAAVLQEKGRAKVVGVETTGKGEGQQTFALSDGSLISFSTIKYFLPSGASIGENGGIKPDFSVEMEEEKTAQIGRLAPGEDVQLEKAKQAVAEMGK